MSLDKFTADDLESWRADRVTEALARAIRTSRAQTLEAMAGDARAGKDKETHVAGGRVGGYDDVLRMIATQGVKDE